MSDQWADKKPIHCHSHNDYWRQEPLYSAIQAGCSSVEADIWHIDSELYVGHNRLSLKSVRTLRNLYLDPLLNRLEKQNPSRSSLSSSNESEYSFVPVERHPWNGVFDADPTRTFILLIDFKSSGPAIWWQFQKELSPLRDKGYLTYYNRTSVIEGPVTLVATGNALFEWFIAEDAFRDVFFDAPLENLADLSSTWPNPNHAQDPTRQEEHQLADHNNNGVSEAVSNIRTRRFQQKDGGSTDGELAMTRGLGDHSYNQSNSYYASASFKTSIGNVLGSRLTQQQLQLIRSQIRGAHRQGLKVRYWDVPHWPIGLRNHIWHILTREGVDVLSVDDLYAATQIDWRRKRSWNWSF